MFGHIRRKEDGVNDGGSSGKGINDSFRGTAETEIEECNEKEVNL